MKVLILETRPRRLSSWLVVYDVYFLTIRNFRCALSFSQNVGCDSRKRMCPGEMDRLEF